MRIQTSGNMFGLTRPPVSHKAISSQPMRSREVELEQQAYIDRFCEVMGPPDTSHHKADTSDEFERHFGNIEEIEHQVDLENLQQEEAHLRAQKQA